MGRHIGIWIGLALLPPTLLTSPTPRHIHRADLHRGLLQCAESLGVESFFDCKVVDADPGSPSVITKDGKQWTADLIIASDGEHLATRLSK